MTSHGKHKLRELSNCRVCGMDSGIRKITTDVPELHFVECEVCGFKTKKHTSMAHATREWNGGYKNV
jgi:hypothetical protein